MAPISRRIHIDGIVQGVGFRPFIYNLAKNYQLTGWVRNSANGVDIEVTGTKPDVNNFISDIKKYSPPLSQIDSMEVKSIREVGFDSFEIIASKNKSSDFLPISPDVATCTQCVKELFDPKDHRYRYPFINCTNCGPRFSIIKDIPYDRPQTTMADFKMCSECREEYQNPLDRRFHAQPIACPVCGPHVWLENSSSVISFVEEPAIQEARRMIAKGKILAIKGLGGFHLACDASNPEAVSRLRNYKKRSAKPFALMAPDLAAVNQFVHLSPAAEALLTSPQAPIVLIPKRSPSSIAENVAPAQSNLGFMLPYTPLHHLIIQKEKNYPLALVMTSGNLAEEPILHKNQPASKKLAAISDAFLMHNRPIHRRIDDSVFTILNEKPYPIRRARGYAPNPIRISKKLPQILAVGPQMKNTFCLTRDRYAFISHYIGEMDNWETYQDFKAAIQHFESLFRIKPAAIAYDLHPDYISTTYANERASKENLPAYPVQHHHAHLAAVMVENQRPFDQNVAGLIFDGTGYGKDGSIWGGEVLVGNCQDFTRFMHLKPIPLPGGDVSIRKPARMALSALYAYDLPWDETLAPVKALSTTEISALKNQLEKHINTPLTTSMGRVFDAVSALIGIREAISYEAQAAIELEALCEINESGYYPWELKSKNINLKLMFQAILADLSLKVPQSVIAARFHNTMARLSLALAKLIEKEYGIHEIVLSGGVWQNIVLIEKTIQLLMENGFQPLIHHQLPPNDGCVAFGQAMIAAYKIMKDKE